MRRAVSIAFVIMLAACSRSTAADAKPQATPAPASAPASAPPAAQSTPPPAAAQLQPPAAKPVPPQLPEIVARINGETISGVELDRAVKALEGRAGGPVPADQRDRVFRGVLDEMIGYKLLVQEAKTRKIVVPDSDIEAQVAQIRSQFPNQQQFDQALAAQKMTLQDIRDDARSEMSVEKLVEGEIATKIAVKPEAVTDFYQKNQDKFQQGPRVRASHILISVPQNADAATKQQAKTKAEAILKDLKGGKDFAATAKENSQDPGSAVNGGDLGFFEKGQMVPPFEQAAFALNAGDMSDLVETQFGYHIIKVAEKQTQRVVPLDEAKPQIEQYLSQQSRQAETQAFVDALKAKAKIEILI
ncbi:MAG TPA: peptidylprolyl isomerase [Vicinamibacterales bacterium]|nr:peptidylprolyl isomerase [Vicinamibacterales bacterium]